MAIKKPKISYDPESQIVSIRISKEKSVDSDVYGNVVIDYGKNGKMVNVDIMDVSMNEFKRVPAVKKLIHVMA
ncbi:MAG: DUF2283 domain-containing protein [Patescibacteria group bacterium]